MTLSRNELLPWPLAVFAVSVCVLAAGCTGKPGPGPASKAAARPAPIPQQAARPAGSPTPAGAAEAKNAPQRRAFKPPFPNRRELFLPPQKPVDAPASQQVDRPRVKLMGFANLDGLKALVSVDGLVTPVERGEFRGDVQVISIEPPRVTFQHGGHRWTESLFTQPR